jgi:hypothetical protein
MKHWLAQMKRQGHGAFDVFHRNIVHANDMAVDRCTVELALNGCVFLTVDAEHDRCRITLTQQQAQHLANDLRSAVVKGDDYTKIDGLLESLEVGP